MRNQSTVTKHRVKTIILFLFAAIIAGLTVSAQDNSVRNTALTTGRLESILISLVGLISLILSIRYFRSSKKAASASKRKAVLITGAAALICIVLSGVHIANSNGGFGTGSGKAGAIVAIALGLTAIILSAITLNRFRHAR
jgi:hypothetical protein